jgi:hypothetical protein
VSKTDYAEAFSNLGVTLHELKLFQMAPASNRIATTLVFGND